MKTQYLQNGKKEMQKLLNMKLSDIILKEGVEKRMVNFLDDLHSNKRTISVEDFMQEFGVSKDEAIDFIHKWNMSKVDRSVAEGISLSEPNEDMEKLINRGIKKINIGSSDEEDILYYVHNNWMGGYISAEEAMKKISKYLDPR